MLGEATSNLDSENERLIKVAVARLMTGRTTLIIAHRLSTILSADRVVMIDHGQVVASGHHAWTPRSLWSRESSRARSASRVVSSSRPASREA